MPNWCTNTLTIQGSADTIKALWESAHTEEVNEAGETVKNFGLLQAMNPMPEELNHTEGLSDGPNWYDWRVSNWGTKWEISDEGLEFIDNGDGTAAIIGWFDSAWAPPIAAYEKFCDDMDGVYLESYYDEPGMCFVGYWSSEGGDDYYEYSEFNSKNIREHIPEYLVDEFELEDRLAEYEEMEAEFDNEDA